MAKKHIATFLSVGTFNTLGDYCYAYSGLIQTATDSQNALTFTTGNYISVVELQLNSPLSKTAPQFAGIAAALVALNGIEIANIKAGGSEQADDNPTSERMQMIIPPNTEVVVTIDSNVATADSFISVTITGRLYA